MIIAFGAFLLNNICAVVPCHPTYEPPRPVPFFIQSRPQPVEETRISDNVIPRSVYKHKPNPNFIKNPRPHFPGPGHRKQIPPAHPIKPEPKPKPTPPPPVASVKIPILKSPYVVSTQSGKVEGFPMRTIRSKKIVAFTGVPYAESPVKRLRYSDPVPKKPWNGVLKANSFGPDCLQIDGMQSLQVIGSIDCLYLNVYTPQLPSADTMGNLQGFLTTGDSAAPGNYGLKDQTLVLKWVQANIASFSGNPSNVMLIGQSAGGVSVHLHMMSPESQGLFKTAVSLSGNAFCFWGVRQNSVDFTYRLANSVRCPTNDSFALVECMRELDPLQIAYHEAKLPDYKVFPGVFFGPSVEPHGPNAFLTERPDVLYERGMVSKIPWINGFLVGEGNGVSFLTWLYPFVMREVDARWVELGPKILDIKGDPKYTSKVAAYIKNFYFGNKQINFDTRTRLAQMVGDRLIVSAIYKGLRYHSKVAPTYGYFFNFTGRIGTAAIYGLKTKDWGISHDDDLVYLFNSTTYGSLKIGDPEYNFSEFLINILTNFGKYGEPLFVSENGIKVPFWKPVESSPEKEVQVVTLDGKVPKMIDIPFRNRIKFWEKLNLVSDSFVSGFPDQNHEMKENDKTDHGNGTMFPTLPKNQTVKVMRASFRQGR